MPSTSLNDETEILLNPIPNCRPLNFSNAFKEWNVHSRKELIEVYEKKYKLMPKEDYFINPPERQQISSGEKRLKEFEHTLANGFNKSLNRFQRELALVCTQALTPMIMGQEEWLKHGPEILKKRMWKVPKKIVCALSSRRMGKTYMMIRILVCLSKVLQNKRYALASTAQRISDESKQVASELLEELGTTPYRSNRENIWLKDEPDNPKSTKSKMCFYPSSPKVEIINKLKREEKNHSNDHLTSITHTQKSIF